MSIFQVHRWGQCPVPHLDRADKIDGLRLPRLAQYIEVIGPYRIAAPGRLDPVLLEVLVRPVAPLSGFQVDEVKRRGLKRVSVNVAVVMRQVDARCPGGQEAVFRPSHAMFRRAGRQGQNRTKKRESKFHEGQSGMQTRRRRVETLSGQRPCKGDIKASRLPVWHVFCSENP